MYGHYRRKSCSCIFNSVLTGAFLCANVKSIYPNLAIIRGTNTVAKDLPECSALLCITQKTMEIDQNNKCV